MILSEGKSLAVPAAPVAKVVDTTGAGDLYAAGFLYGIASGRGIETAGRLGSLAAAEIISHIGARPEKKLQDLAKQGGIAGLTDAFLRTQGGQGGARLCPRVQPRAARFLDAVNAGGRQCPVPRKGATNRSFEGGHGQSR